MIRTWGYGTVDDESRSAYAAYQFDSLNAFAVASWHEAGGVHGSVAAGLCLRAIYDLVQPLKGVPSDKDVREILGQARRLLREAAEQYQVDLDCSLGLVLMGERSAAFVHHGGVVAHHIRDGEVRPLAQGPVPGLQPGDVLALAVGGGEHKALGEGDWSMPHRAVRKWLEQSCDSPNGALVAVVMAMSPEFIPSTPPPPKDLLVGALEDGARIRTISGATRGVEDVVPTWGRGRLLAEEEPDEQERFDDEDEAEEEEEVEKDLPLKKRILRAFQDYEEALEWIEGYVRTPGGQRRIAALVVIVVLALGPLTMVSGGSEPAPQASAPVAPRTAVVVASDGSASFGTAAASDAGGSSAGGSSAGAASARAPTAVSARADGPAPPPRPSTVRWGPIGVFALVIVGMLVAVRRSKAARVDPMAELKHSKLRRALDKELCAAVTVGADHHRAVGLSRDGSSLWWGTGGGERKSNDKKRVVGVQDPTLVQIPVASLVRAHVVVDHDVVAKGKGGYKETVVTRLDVMFHASDPANLVHRLRLVDTPVVVGSDAHQQAVASARLWEGVVLAILHGPTRALPDSSWEVPPDMEFGELAL